MLVIKPNPETSADDEKLGYEEVVSAFAQAETNITIAAGFIPVGQETHPHRHAEKEVFIAIQGCASISDGTNRFDFQPGDIGIAEQLDSHSIRCEGDRPFLFATAYWFPDTRMTSLSGLTEATELPVVVMSTPPTPNGDLHLGHLSGPYLGADAHTRYLRRNGGKAFHISASDDFQSYVVSLAEAEDSTPERTAARYAKEISDTLELLDIQLDYYTSTSTDALYKNSLCSVARKIAESPQVTYKASLATVHPKSGKYVYEATLRGECPKCGSPCGGNICEECGFPNVCIDVCNPKTRDGMNPVFQNVARYHINPVEFRTELLDHYRSSVMTPRLRRFTSEVLNSGIGDMAISHPAHWGIPIVTPDENEQVLWVWVEMAFGLTSAIESLRRAGKLSAAEHASDGSAFPADIKIVHFFGFDNSFYHTVIFPIFYRLLYGSIPSNIAYVSNEFYLLDGKKFSTSRRHAVWGKDILKKWPSDAVRFFLAKTRPESHRTNFTLAEFTQVVDKELRGKWQGLFDEINDICARRFEGCAPVCGTWVSQHLAFLSELERSIAAITPCYEAGSFSLQKAVGGLSHLVESCQRFATEAEFYDGDDQADDSLYRTSVALLLAAIRLLGGLSFPILPRLSGRLNADLGFTALDEKWPDGVRLVPGGQLVRLSKYYFDR